MLGILSLDTQFPRIAGDVGAADTFAFPVRHATVAGASVDEIVHHGHDALLPEFVLAAQELVEQGCVGIATTCGFLVRWQRELAAALDVPVLTSALLMLPLVQRTLPQRRRVGIVTYSAAALAPALVEAAGGDASAPIRGVDASGYFATLIRCGGRELETAKMAADVVAAARHLVAQHRDVGAIVLECANMPPYRDDVAAATGLPVFDATQLISWFYAGIAGTARRHDLW